jgi:hypothetical protein
MRTGLLATLVFMLAVVPVVYGQEESSLNEHLNVFKPLLGKTWRGKFAGSTAEKPLMDIARWERAMNGQAIRILHSVNEGEYGGESIIMWDKKQSKIAFWYFTTAGFFTQGTMSMEGNSWSSIEEVTGNANGITQVKSTSKILDNGNLQVKAEFFADGKWTPGHEILYEPAPTAEVKFK